MKKIYIISLIIVSLFLGIKVNAETIRTPKLIYDIKEVNTDTEEKNIIISGWAFIQDYNNHGGTTTYITIKAKNSKGVEYDGTTTYNNTTDKAIFNANCYRDDRNSCVESYENSTCKEAYTYNGVLVSIPTCRYDNVSFTSTFNINDMLNKLGTDNNITFEIYVKNTNYNNTLSSPLAVSTSASKLKDKIIKYNGIDINVNVSGIGETATVTIVEGRVLSGTGGSFKFGPSFVWEQQNTFKILDNAISTNDNFTGLTMYKLEYIPYCRNTEKKELQCSTKDETRRGEALSISSTKGNYYKNYSKESGWAYSTWLQVDGSMSINFEQINYCPTEGGEKDNKIINLNCKNGSYNQQKKVTINITDNGLNINDYPEYDLIESGQCASNEVTRIIEGYAIINQDGDASFYIDDNKIHAGGGFKFSASYTSKTSYSLCTPLKYTIIDQYYDETEKKCLTKKETKKVEINSKEYERVASYMKNLVEEPKGEKKTESYDSNEVSKEYKKIGNWKTTKWNARTDKWYPGEDIEYKIEFELPNAYINLQTAKVIYTTPDNKNDYIDAGNLYFIPIKYMNNEFPIKVNLSDINILKEDTVAIKYECGVKCIQKLYKEEDKKIKYNLIYRPISLGDPFPNRMPANNWIKLYQDKVNYPSVIQRNNLEYELNLTPEMIKTIKKENKKINYTSFINSEDDKIETNGQSKYITDLQTRFSNNFLTRTNTYNWLGKCQEEKKCWLTESSYKNKEQ